MVIIVVYMKRFTVHSILFGHTTVAHKMNVLLLLNVKIAKYKNSENSENISGRFKSHRLNWWVLK